VECGARISQLDHSWLQYCCILALEVDRSSSSASVSGAPLATSPSHDDSIRLPDADVRRLFVLVGDVNSICEMRCVNKQFRRVADHMWPGGVRRLRIDYSRADVVDAAPFADALEVKIGAGRARILNIA